VGLAFEQMVAFTIDHKSAFSFSLSQNKKTFFAAPREMEKPRVRRIPLKRGKISIDHQIPAGAVSWADLGKGEI